MKINRYSGLVLGLGFFVLIFIIGQTGQLYNAEGILGYFQNATLVFNFTSLFIPALISSLIFPLGGYPDLYIILGFSAIQFLGIGFLLGKHLESNKK